MLLNFFFFFLPSYASRKNTQVRPQASQFWLAQLFPWPHSQSAPPELSSPPRLSGWAPPFPVVLRGSPPPAHPCSPETIGSGRQSAPHPGVSVLRPCELSSLVPLLITSIGILFQREKLDECTVSVQSEEGRVCETQV